MQATSQQNSALGEWLDDFVSTLRGHQLQIETGTASSEVNDFYRTLMEGNGEEFISMNKKVAQKYFVQKIIFEYLNELSKDIPNKLAFDYNDSEVLVWAEIDDDDSSLERKLVLTEAEINARYHKFGFDMNSTIVEESDRLSIPQHYIAFK